MSRRFATNSAFLLLCRQLCYSAFLRAATNANTVRRELSVGAGVKSAATVRGASLLTYASIPRISGTAEPSRGESFPHTAKHISPFGAPARMSGSAAVLNAERTALTGSSSAARAADTSQLHVGEKCRFTAFRAQ